MILEIPEKIGPGGRVAGVAGSNMAPGLAEGTGEDVGHNED